MMITCWFIFALLATNLFATLEISSVKYDNIRDEIVIDTRYQGKCLPHELFLHRAKSKNEYLRFSLTLSNLDRDPCNGIAQQRKIFTMGHITQRPVSLLISPRADGSMPHLVNLPQHERANIIAAKYQSHMKKLLVIINAGGEDFSADRFYIDILDTCTGEYAPTCEAIIRDKQARMVMSTPTKKREVLFDVAAIERPITLEIRLTPNNQTARIHLP